MITALVRVTEAAALAARHWIGREQREAGDQAAVNAMRRTLATIDMRGVIVSGEGAKDRAPMLADGEVVGTGLGPDLDIAVDPVEGTALLAAGRADAISVIAVAPRGTMWVPGPAFYMQKLVVGRDACAAIVPNLLHAPVAVQLNAIAQATGRVVTELTVFVLDKPRHATLIAMIRAAGARVLLRTDGDINGALLAATPEAGVDALMGIGGTPEGILSACAVRALGGAMLGQLAPQRPAERDAALAAGLDLDRVWTAADLVASDDVAVAITGITDGLLVPGVRDGAAGPITTSLAMSGKTRQARTIRRTHAQLVES